MAIARSVAIAAIPAAFEWGITLQEYQDAL